MTVETAAMQAGTNDPRNPGMALDAAMFEGHPVNRSAAERRAASLIQRRSVKKDWQAAWLINAIRCIDLTTLAGDDTAERVRRLCAKARQPLAPHIVAHPLMALPADYPQAGRLTIST